MSPQISNLLPYLATILSIGVTLGGLAAWRSSYSKEAGQIQERVIAALKQEVDMLKEENKRLDQILEALTDTFKSREIYITIQGHQITIKEGKETIVTRISDDPTG